MIRTTKLSCRSLFAVLLLGGILVVINVPGLTQSTHPLMLSQAWDTPATSISSLLNASPSRFVGFSPCSFLGGAGDVGPGFEDLEELIVTTNILAQETGESAETVELEEGQCFYKTKPMHEQSWNSEEEIMEPNPKFTALFTAIEETEQFDLSIKEEAVRALRGQRYTDYWQTGYAIENGIANPFKSGSFVECNLGCFPRISYFGKTYTNVCIEQICTEGRVTDTGLYCHNGDVYFHKLTFWCQDFPEVSMYCGEGAHCAQRPNGSFFCEGDVVGSSSGSQSQIEYALTAPRNASGQFTVAAYKNGAKLAEKPISSLRVTEFVQKHGPLNASQAAYYAQVTGLAALVEASFDSTTNWAIHEGNTTSSNLALLLTEEILQLSQW